MNIIQTIPRIDCKHSPNAERNPCPIAGGISLRMKSAPAASWSDGGKEAIIAPCPTVV
ncbi:hypothetical protein [Bacteroides fragilis]|uniref:hypothetical protein n=1 Tax=Bacteroides fragilis TaxID=817 RepID=UPI0018AF8ADC|nr:hypothetical protein [Bacteroides fragilis]